MNKSQNKAGGVTTFEDFENYKNEEEDEFTLSQNQQQQHQQSFGFPEGSDSNNQKFFLEQIESTNKKKLNIEQLFQQQEEFNQNLNLQSNSQFQQFSKSAGQNICLLHNEELGDVFCLTCNSLNLCLQCVCKGEHQSHQIMNIKKAQELASQKLEYYKKLLEEKASLVQSFQEQISLEKENLHQAGGQHKNYINKKFSEFHQMLDEKHQQLLQDFDKTMRLKNDRISFAINNINTQLQIFVNYLSEIDKVLQGEQTNGGQQMINFYTEHNDMLDNIIKQQIQDQFEKEMVHLTESQVDIFMNDKQLKDNIQFLQLQIHENYSDYLAYKKIFTNKLQQTQNNFLQSSASQTQLLQQSSQQQQQASNSPSKLNNNINNNAINNNKLGGSKIDNINAYIYQSQKKLQNMERQNLLTSEINLNKVLDSKKKQVAVIKAEINQQLAGFNFKFDAVQDQQFFEKEPGKGEDRRGEVPIEENEDLNSFKKDIDQNQQKLQQQQQKQEKPLEEIQLNFQKEQQQQKQLKFNQSGLSQKSNPPPKTSFLDYSQVSQQGKNTGEKSEISLMEFRKKHLQNSQLINYQSQSGAMGQTTNNMPEYLSVATYTKKQLTSNYQNSRLQSLSKKLEKSMKDDRNISSSLNISQSISQTQKKKQTKDQLMNELGSFGAGSGSNKNSFRNKIGLVGTFGLFPQRNPNPISGRDFQYNNKFSTTDKHKKSFF